MKRTSRIHLALTLGALLVAGIALADKTVTYLTAPAVVDTITFQFGAANRVVATVCGHTQRTGGIDTDAKCYDRELPTGQFKTDVLALRTGQARTFWLTQEGL
jgi:hypothetical protein